MYQARQFANLAGVTVRTLHHYDRMGLLRPRRSQSGYRQYGDRDLERLEQIVALKFIGVSLGDIRSCSTGGSRSPSPCAASARRWSKSAG